jgi:hypothetical protein
MSRLLLGLAVTLFVLTALPSLASRKSAEPASTSWVEVGVSTDGVRASVDSASIETDGDETRVLQRFILPPKLERATAYVDQTVVYSCSSASVRTLTSTEFDAENRVLRRETAESIEPYQVRPGTLPRYIWDVVC